MVTEMTNEDGRDSKDNIKLQYKVNSYAPVILKTQDIFCARDIAIFVPPIIIPQTSTLIMQTMSLKLNH